jgi:GT2 family glycosyltransferase
MKICIVPVCYNSYEDAVKLLGSIEVAFKKTENVYLDVVLSDNSTSNNYFSDDYSYSFYYQKNENVGYFPAFNKGLSVLKDDVSKYDFVIVCNVDLVISEDFFTELQGVTKGDNVGLIAPSIISSNDGRDLNPKMKVRPSKFKIRFMQLVCSNFMLFNLYQKVLHFRESRRANKYSEEVPVGPVLKGTKCDTFYGAHGSFMIFTKRYFEAGASVNYPRFLFGEEGFVAEQLCMNKLCIFHQTKLKVFDKEHASTSQESSKFMCSEHKKSYRYFYDNFLKK